MIFDNSTIAKNSAKLNGHSEEYFGTQAEVSEIGDNSARNLLPYPYNYTTSTVNGVTFTDNGDGTLTADGTATAWASFKCIANMEIQKGKYILSGCPDGGGVNLYRIAVYVPGETYPIANDYGDGCIIDNTDGKYSTISIVCAVSTGITAESITFKPMLELGSVAHSWKPYNYGNADTLDGAHLSDVRKWYDGECTNFNTTLTRGKYRVIGSNTTGAPYSGLIYGTLYNEIADNTESAVLGDSAGGWLTQIFINTAHRIYIRQSINGADFTEWEHLTSNTDLANYIKKTGDVFTGGIVVKKTTNWGQYVLYSSSGYYRALETSDDIIRLDIRDDTSVNNRRYIDFHSKASKSDVADVLSLVEITDGIAKGYPILHKGNSAPVAIQPSSPSDTSALWVVPNS